MFILIAGVNIEANIYSDTVISLGAKLSYSRERNLYDNMYIENVFIQFKKELIYQLKIRAFQKTKESLLKYIEDWCNSCRIQKNSGYLFPLEFSKKLV